METVRRELKFSIPAQAAEMLKRKLHTFLKYDTNGIDGTYNIKSLYFDDPYDTALKEKLDGADKSPKFRIRIYNDDDSLIKLERKQKKGDIVRKDSILIQKDEYNGLVNGVKLLSENYPELHMKLLKPKVIVSYDRTAFVCEPGKVRITFDTNIRASISTRPDLFKPNGFISVYPNHHTILEVKYTGIFPYYLRGIFGDAQSAQSISKYAISRVSGVL